MKKVFIALLAAILGSCEYHDLQMKICYLALEETLSNYATFTYNNQNQIVTYTSSGVSTSTLTYNDAGKIVSELDDQIFLITYSYDSRNRIILWSQTIQGDPTDNIQTKFFYNSQDQDTLQQYFRYHLSSNTYYLWKYARRDFANKKNYSRIRTYDAATDTLLYTEDFLWDNHPNPYLTNAFFLNSPPPTNNETQYTLTIVGYAPQTTNYTYTYNGNGFPIEKRIPYFNTPVARYTYSNCR